MRPDPEHTYTESSDSGRIIYLGDVRRRKAARKNALPDRHYLASIAVLAGLGWAIWLTVLFTVPPSRLLTYVAFSAPLSLGLGATSTLIAYAVEFRTTRVASVGRSIRRGSFLSVLVIGNLALLGAHRWTVLALVAMLAVILVLDLRCERRFHQRAQSGRPPRI